MHTLKTETSGFMVVMLIQLTFVLVFGLFVRYDEALLPPPLGEEDGVVAAEIADNAENRTTAGKCGDGEMTASAEARSCVCV